MPAKPQQMADNQEKSDDLIAELAKLMASNAQGAEAESKPSVIKLTPLGEAKPAPSSPVRIPGMDAPKPAAPSVAPAAGNVRMPGMEAPTPADPPPTATPPQDGASADARPTVPPAVSATPQPSTPPAAPLVVAPKLDTPEVPAIPVGSAAKAAAAFAQPRSTSTPFDAGLRPAGGTNDEGKPAPAPPPPAEAPAKAETPPVAQAADDDSFDFDFGFGFGGQPAAVPPTAAPADERTQRAGDSADDRAEDEATEDDQDHQVAEDEDGDPIADLINAELGGPEAGDSAERKVQYPASVEAVPSSNYGRTGVQAPVLIGHPARAAAQPEQQPASGNDRFSVAPVFGLGGATPREEPSTEDPDGDPMAEIESLIGEAVRVQLNDPEQQQQAQQPPVVPPLNTGFAPRRAGLRDVEPRTRSAEEAILAAAAATGAEVGRVEPSMAAEEGPYRRTRVKPPNTNSFSGLRQYLGIGVAAVLLLAAGLGLYWVLGIGRGDPDTAPVLTADTAPVKEAPAATATETAEAPRSVVFDEIDGIAGAGEDETLVSRDETADTPITDVARVEDPEVTESGLANRRVRTVTVRPDGTIVSADDAVAGSEALPVERPNVPELPGGSEQPSELLTAATEATEAASATAAETAEDPIAALMAGTEAATAGVGSTEETTALAALSGEPDAPVVFDGSLTAPVPMPRPTDRSSLGGAGQAAVSTSASSSVTANAPASVPLVSLTGDAPAAATTPAPAATTPAPAASANANAYVQLASLPSEGEAQSQVNAMQSRWGNLFGGQSLVVQRAELSGGRVTYRLRLPTASLQDATRICASIKANGGDCFATNG